jgi:hypothetical protein
MANLILTLTAMTCFASLFRLPGSRGADQSTYSPGTDNTAEAPIGDIGLCDFSLSFQSNDAPFKSMPFDASSSFQDTNISLANV